MSAAKRKYWDRKKRVFDKYGGKCAYCGGDINFDKFEVDHAVSKFEAKYKKLNIDIESFDNLNPACCSCNNYKRAHSVEGFREEIEAQIFRLRRDRPTFKLAERYGQITCHKTPVVFYFEIYSNG